MADQTNQDNILMLGTYNMMEGLSGIYRIDSLEDIKPEKIYECEGEISSLCYHNGKLLAGIVSKVVDVDDEKTLIDKELEKVASMYTRIGFLCSHEGVLFDASYKKISNTLDEKIIAEREKSINSLTSYEGKLYDSSGNQIFNTFKNEVIVTRGQPLEHIDDVMTITVGTEIESLCNHNGKLFYINNDRGDNNTRIHEISRNDVTFAREQSNKITAPRHLVSHNGKLIAGTHAGLSIINTTEIPLAQASAPKEIGNLHEIFNIDFRDFRIKTMASIPRKKINPRGKEF